MNVALITGAANGIGLALSTLYLQQGHAVIMVDKNEAKLNEEAGSLSSQFPQKVSTYSCDISNNESVQYLAQCVEEQGGRIDWIYNNAGIIGELAPVWELKAEHIEQVMEINLYGMIHIIRAFMPLLLKQQVHAHIINMASLYALSSGSQMASYAMSKHAVLALSESLYFDIKRLEYPIDVSVIFPSFTDTGLLASTSSQQHSAFHDSLNTLLTHSRPALDVAAHIIKEVEQKRFYIMPDKEVKGYCEERARAVVLQENPHINNIEKLMNSLIKRKRKF